MSCSLCRNNVELKKSHIIPEFLYKTLYDKKHRFHVLSTSTETPHRLLHKGLYERLLCEDCEQKFSAWEHYASLALNGGIPLIISHKNNLICISGLDYKKFKLFQLSILWRAGISKLSFFKNVQLGIHSEKIRKLLLSNEPGAHSRYGCVMIGITHEGEALTDIIMPPSRIRIQSNVAYRFVFGGIMWVMLVANHDHTSNLCNSFINPNGDTILIIREAMEMQTLINFSKKLNFMNHNFRI